MKKYLSGKSFSQEKITGANFCDEKDDYDEDVRNCLLLEEVNASCLVITESVGLEDCLYVIKAYICYMIVI
jgi:hypothetical protein